MKNKDFFIDVTNVAKRWLLDSSGTNTQTSKILLQLNAIDYVSATIFCYYI